VSTKDFSIFPAATGTFKQFGLHFVAYKQESVPNILNITGSAEKKQYLLQNSSTNIHRRKWRGVRPA